MNKKVVANLSALSISRHSHSGIYEEMNIDSKYSYKKAFEVGLLRWVKGELAILMA